MQFREVELQGIDRNQPTRVGADTHSIVQSLNIVNRHHGYHVPICITRKETVERKCL